MPISMNENRRLKRMITIEIATFSLMWPTLLILKRSYPESISWTAAILIPLAVMLLLSLQFLLLAWVNKRNSKRSEKINCD